MIWRLPLPAGVAAHRWNLCLPLALPPLLALGTWSGDLRHQLRDAGSITTTANGITTDSTIGSSADSRSSRRRAACDDILDCNPWTGGERALERSPMGDADSDALAYHAHLDLGACRRLRIARVFELVPAGH